MAWRRLSKGLGRRTAQDATGSPFPKRTSAYNRFGSRDLTHQIERTRLSNRRNLITFWRQLWQLQNGRMSDRSLCSTSWCARVRDRPWSRRRTTWSMSTSCEQPLVHWAQQPSSPANPVRQCRAIEGNALVAKISAWRSAACSAASSPSAFRMAWVLSSSLQVLRRPAQ